MGEAFPDAPEFSDMPIPEQPEPNKSERQNAAREDAGKSTSLAKEAAPADKEAKKPEQSCRGRPPKRYEQEQGENAEKIKALRLELKKLEDKRMDVTPFWKRCAATQMPPPLPSA